MFKKLFGSDQTSSGDAYAQRGLEAMDRDDPAQAIEALTRALQLGVANYDPAEMYTILGRAHKDLSQYDQAIAAHKKSLELKPDYHKAWNNLGIVHFNRNDYEEAEACYRQALACEPTYAFAMASLGAVYVHQNKTDEAIAVLTQAIELVPGMAIAHANLALGYAQAGQYDAADASLKQAILLGYTNWQTIQQRIKNLREVAGERSDDHPFAWLPAVCPRCGAPIGPTTVTWIDGRAANCTYCGVNITPASAS